MANVTFKGNPMTLVGTEVKVGDQAPNFQVLANVNRGHSNLCMFPLHFN
ncbi:redoxin domain-containing protein [Bacillus cereus]|nr:redoxin domain-containing protein [Bacillus cereus]